ncbi:MAG: orotidine 5'-phosphate decarboxylase [Candidatus Lokiarchaeota archaeon]|nr:orotidine 5'-phosphate decarboxylase [Candidatus Lokiarchaeota archaeon]
MIEVRKPPLLQVALDLESMDQALQIASEVAPYVDIIEAGTPLIKSEGIRIVRALKDAHPDKLICADLKIADAGYLEVRMAAKSKANIITVLADAYDITIIETLRAAHEFNVEIMADLIMSRKPAKRLKEIVNLNYKNTKLQYSLVHSGLDRQESRHSPLSEIESVAYMQNRPKLAIAGGITKSEIPKLKPYPLDIIIIGGAITRAENPKKVAEEIRKLVDLAF